MSSIYHTIRPLLPESSLLAGVAALGGFIAISVVVNVVLQLLPLRSKNAPPMVFHYFPVIGSTVTYGMDPYKFMFDNRKKYGDVFTFILLGRKINVALGPGGSNMILNGKLSHVNAEEAYTHLTTPVFGSDVVYDCPNHLLMEQKKFMKVGLSTDAFKSYIPLIRNEVLAHIEERIFGTKKDSHAASTVSTPKDAVATGSQITICTAAVTLQGKEVREGLDASFADYYHDLDGGFTPLNFMFPNLPLPSYRRRDEAHIKMRKFYLGIMEKRRESGSFDGEGHDMLQALQGVTYKNGHVLTDKEIAHMMIALLMAGQHTSAATSSWLLLHLATRPDLQEALYEEQVKTYGRPDGTLEPLDYDRLQTPLLNSTIREVLRLHPPIHSIMRKVVDDMPVTHLEGKQYVIKKGEYVLAAPGVTQIDPLLWKDASEFIPQRWMGESNEVSQQLKDDAAGEVQDFGWGAISTGASSPYLPFGAGRHRCIGEQFAHVQLASIVATLIRNVTWSLANGSDKVPDQDYTTMIVMPTKPRDIVYKRRSGSS
ncbi:cytochrome P450 [Cystobasidium minutum MCA 4210]|uniref:cytochrome P450 n=1 Tax=Cystobasidium minutum MCA 4210 TaxID=1397322 RepID=UPI0034CFF8DC|eukprot:jgi/Rhomi1/113672/CE113671_17875